MLSEHSEIKANIKAHTAESHARILEDVQKLKDHPDYVSLPSMVRCYIDIVAIDIELLMKQVDNAHAHIDYLDYQLDRHTATYS